MQKGLPVLPWLLTVVSFSCWIQPALLGQELLQNGDFEAGRLPPWNVTQVSGSAVTLVAENSPFLSFYPAGAASVRINDDDSDFEQPSFSQAFDPHPAISFAFDFKILSAGGQVAPWYLAWQGEDQTTAFFFSLGGQDGVSFEFNQERVSGVKTNTWYHVEGWADAPRQVVRGAIVSSDGQKADFQGGFPFGVKNVLSALELSDGDAAPNASIQFDNFSTRPISLEITRNASGEVVVTWPLADFHLETATTLFPVADWTAIPGVAGAYTNSALGRMRFFRLAR